MDTPISASLPSSGPYLNPRDSPAAFIQSQRRVQCINTFKALMRQRRRPRQNFVVFAYFLYDKPINPDQPHDIPASVIWMGAFDTEKEADDEAERLIEITGHPHIAVANACRWCDLSLNPSTEGRRLVVVDSEGRLLKMKKELENREDQKLENRRKME